jgi:C1A family cysteine protease
MLNNMPQLHFYGWKKQPQDRRDLIYKPHLANVPILPASDLRPGMPKVYDQGNLGSCTANGLAAAVEYMIDKENLPDFMPSRLFIYYGERKIEHTIHEDSGANIRDGIKVLAKYGVCDETTWPYNINKFTKKPSCKCYKQALQNIIEKYEAANTLIDYKSSLSNGIPVPFGFTVFESFESSDVAKTGIVPVPKAGEQIMGGHCVLAVGHNDEKQWLICRNSWGPDWGLAGYFFLPYACFDVCSISDGWVISLVK